MCLAYVHFDFTVEETRYKTIPGSCDEWQTQEWQAHQIVFPTWLPSLGKV